MDRASHPDFPPTLGARCLDGGRCRFRVWAPKVDRIDLKLEGDFSRLLPMAPAAGGYFELLADHVDPGTRYFYRINGGADRPDPASRFQPDGVHGASAVVDRRFDWTDSDWSGIGLHEYITYELHVGTFTSAGTFDAVIDHLDTLAELGVTAVELMPVAQFPGGRNWGYDGVQPFAPQNTYGGPNGLKRLVDACHNRELAVVLDVVYNHLGPEGNYLGQFGPYFTDRYRTPWGEAVNFDGPDSDEVRRFFIENALYWIDEYHVDALRLDAVHAIFDASARPIMRQLADAVRLEGERSGRRVYTVAESSLNDSRLIRPKEQGGCGVDAQWCDDFHHALRTTITNDASGYYRDFHGFDDLVKSYRDAFVEDGRYSPYRGRRHGNSARDIRPSRFVVCSQNHDQVGNRMLGERLTELISFDKQKVAAALVLLSPYQPMLFMGEEYGETARFQYFTSHSDEQLVEAVRRGRQDEFQRFLWDEEPPDPQDEATFERCKLQQELRDQGHHRTLQQYYAELIDLRKREPALAFADRTRMETLALVPRRVMGSHRWSHERQLFVVFHFGDTPTTVELPLASGRWAKLLDSAESRWLGAGDGPPASVDSAGGVPCRLAPHSVAVFGK